MDAYNKFKTKAFELLIKAQKKYTVYKNELEEDVLFLKETQDRYSTFSGSLSQAMMQQTELIERKKGKKKIEKCCELTPFCGL